MTTMIVLSDYVTHRPTRRSTSTNRWSIYWSRQPQRCLLVHTVGLPRSVQVAGACAWWLPNNNSVNQCCAQAAFVHCSAFIAYRQLANLPHQRGSGVDARRCIQHASMPPQSARRCNLSCSVTSTTACVVRLRTSILVYHKKRTDVRQRRKYSQNSRNVVDVGLHQENLERTT